MQGSSVSPWPQVWKKADITIRPVGYQACYEITFLNDVSLPKVYISTDTKQSKSGAYAGLHVISYYLFANMLRFLDLTAVEFMAILIIVGVFATILGYKLIYAPAYKALGDLFRQNGYL